MAERTDFPVNSHKARDEKKVAKVTKDEVSIQKGSTAKKIGESFVSEDASTVKEYLIFDVLIPAAKETLSNVVKTAVDMFLFGGTRGSNIERSRNSSTYRPYNSMYDEKRGYSSRPSRRNSVPGYELVGFTMTREDAENVLDSMMDILRQYEVVSVADVYDLVGIESNYTDNNYGWTRLGSARVVRTRNGWELDLPRPRPID